MKTRSLTVGAFEAKNRFSELLDQVRRGAEITITKHHKPVAKIVAFNSDPDGKRREAASELRLLKNRYSLNGLSVRELIDEGRR